MCGIAANNSLILGGIYVSFNHSVMSFPYSYSRLRRRRIPELASLSNTCWNQTASQRPSEPRETPNLCQKRELASRRAPRPCPPTPVLFPRSSPFPKHEHFTANSIFPQLGSHGTALEFRFVMIKWLHGIVFLRAPPSAFIRICQCRCRSASQSARLHRSPLPPPKLVIPYERRRSWQTHNLITSSRLKIYWIFLPFLCAPVLSSSLNSSFTTSSPSFFSFVV